MRNTMWLAFLGQLAAATACTRTTPSNLDSEDTDVEVPDETDVVDSEPQDSEDEPDTDVQTDTTTIADIQQGDVAVDTVVTLHDVVVSSPDIGGGFFVVDPPGGAYSGVWVYYDDNSFVLEVAPGDVLTITGTVGEYDAEGGTLTELVVAAATDVTVTGTGNLPTATLVTVAELSDLEVAESFEGSLIRVEDVTVTNADLGYGEWQVDDAVVIDDMFYDPGAIMGSQYSSIVGFLHYTHGAYKLEPRSADDVVLGIAADCGAELCPEDLGSGDLVITEYMANPDNLGACADSDGEWFEVYNTTDKTVGLAGIRITDLANNTDVTAGGTVPAGGYAVFGSSSASFCFGTPTTTYNSTTVALNSSSAESITLSVDATEVVLDFIAWEESEKGASTALKSSVSIDATTNDSAENWCTATTVIGTTADLGTPGAANDCM